MSKTTDYRRRMIAAGRCYIDGKPLNLSTKTCDECLMKRRKLSRLRAGCQPKAAGGVGRPTLEDGR